MGAGQIKVDAPSLAEVRRMLGGMKDKAVPVLRRAVNKTYTNVMTAVGKGVRRDYNVTAKRVKAAFGNSKRASNTDMQALLICSGRRLTLMQFTPRKVKASQTGYWGKGKGGGVSYKIRQVGSRKIVEGAWIGKGQAGSGAGARQGDHNLVYKRVRNFVVALLGPSVPTMMQMRLKEYEEAAADGLAKNLAAEVNHIIGG